ncbi:MAG: RNA polymerase sigma factor SigF [Elainellaceae cyanobacterium]
MATISSVRTKSMELLLAYYQNPSTALRNQLVRLNVGLVRKIAHRISHQCAEPYEDLEQIGHIGLIRAIERFDPTQGCAFSSFAVPYIRGEMLHFLRDRGSSVRVPRRWQDLQKEGQREQARLARLLGRQPMEHEVVQALGVSVGEWREARLAIKNRSPLSLDATLSHQTDSTITLGDTLPDLDYQALQRREEDRQILHRALGKLEDRTRKIIEAVFLKGMSRKDVAATLGVSPMTVTRRIQKGLDEMSATLSTQQGDRAELQAIDRAKSATA